MRLVGLTLLLSGGFIAIAALPLLVNGAERAFFVVSGVIVELVGLVLLGRSHRQTAGDRP